MDLVIQHREECGLLPDNRFVFGLAGSREGYIRHSTELRKLRDEIGVENVSTTQMRKYLATSYQVRYFSLYCCFVVLLFLFTAVHIFYNIILTRA